MVVTLHVLFAEDSESNTGSIVDLLTLAGYSVDYNRVESAEQMKTELLTRSWDLIFSSNDNQAFDSSHALSVYHEISLDIPFIILSKTGSIESAVAFIKDGAHEFLIRDNPERLIPVVKHELNEAIIRQASKQGASDLKQKEIRYHRFFENAFTGNYLSTADGQLVDFNPSFLNLLGFTSDEMLSGMNLADLFTNPSELIDIIDMLKERKKPEILEHELICRDGKKINCIQRITGFFTVDGVLDHFIGYLTDITSQRQTEKALTDSEFRYRTLFSGMMEGFALYEIIYDKTGKPSDYRFLTLNPAFERVTGLTADHIIGRTVKEVFPSIDHSWIERYGNVALTSIPIRFDDYSKQLNRHFEVVAYCPKNGQFATIVTDITERKNDEELLQQSKDRLIRGESVSKSGNWELHLKTGKIYGSEGAQRLYGITAENWNLKLIKEVPLPEYRELLDNALIQLVESAVPYDIEFKIRNQISNQIIDIKSIAEYDSNDQIVFGVIQDVTERHITESALLKSEENYHTFFEGSPDSIFLADSKTGQIIDANKAASRLTGKQRAEIIGINHCELHSRDFRRKMEEYFSDLVKNAGEKENYYMAESCVLNSDGSEIPVEILASSFKVNERQVIQGVFRNITERKNSEKELVDREKKYRELANSLPVCVYETDLLGNLTFVNTTTLHLFGYTENELLAGLNVFKFVPESEYQRLTTRFQLIISQQIQTTGEYNAKRKDGTYFPVLISSAVIKKEGEIVGVRGTMVDISERKHTEGRLKKSERTLSNLISNLPGFVYRCNNDKDWTMEYLSDGFTKITGYCVDDIMELKSLTYNDIIHPDYRKYLWDQWQELLKLKLPLEEEYPITTKSGEIKWVWERGRGIFNDDGSLIYLEGFVADITERKRVEQIQKVLYDISTAVLTTQNLGELIEIIRYELGNLLDTSNFYVAFYDEVKGMFYTPHAVDQMDNLESWPADKSLTGYLIKHNKALLISAPEVLTLVENGEIEVIGTPSTLWLGVPLHEEEKIIGAFVVQSYDNPNAYTKKDVEMLEFISHQISLFVQRKKAEGELKLALIKAEESDRLKSAFLATMNHELRTPLNHILGFSELILSGVMPEDNQSFATSIYTSGKNLLAIVEDVFDLALAEQTNVKLRLQTFRLMDQFMENKSSFDQILQSSGKAEQIQLVYKPDTRLLAMYITVDRSKVNQILINLFKNAVKFTNAGTIEFGYQINTPGRLTFFIKDTGIGIAVEKQSMIFDFFRQVDDSRTRIYGGIGIGLSIALKIAKILKGELSVISEPDKGSAFYLTVPVELANVNDPL